MDTPTVKKRGGARPGAGRKAGIPNKLTKTVKEAIEAAFDKVGGADYLAKQAVDNPVAFMTLLGKVIPTQLTGEDGAAIQVVNKIILEGVAPK